MAWAKLDDGIYDKPKMNRLSDRAFRVYINSLAYSARHLTDGHIAAEDVRPELKGTPRTVQELVESGLWQVNGAGFVVNDYLKYNPSKAQIEERRRKTAVKVAQHRKDKARNDDK